VSIVGFGAQGRVLAKFMDTNPEVDKIRVGDIRWSFIKDYIHRYERVEGYKVDASNYNEVLEFTKNSDVIINAVTPEFNINIIKSALENNANYIDMAFGPPYENLDKEIALDSDFKKKNITAITSSGLSPGITNILIANVADDLDAIDSIKLVCAGTMDSDIPFTTWSPEVMIEDCLADTYIYKNGSLVRMPPFSGRQLISLPVIGEVEVFHHIHEELFTLWRFLGKKVNYIEFKFGGLGIEIIYLAYKLGLLSEKPIDVKGTKISPLKVFLSVIPRPPTEDMLVKWINEGIVRDGKVVCLAMVEGYRGDKRVSARVYAVTPSIVDIVRKMPQANHVSYATSASCYIFADMLGKGEVEEKGVYVPEALSMEVRRKFIDKITSLDPPIKVNLELRMEL